MKPTLEDLLDYVLAIGIGMVIAGFIINAIETTKAALHHP